MERFTARFWFRFWFAFSKIEKNCGPPSMSQLASPHQLCFPGGPACAFVCPHRYPTSSPLSGHWRTDVIVYGLALANGLFSILCLLSTQPQPQWLCSWADPIMCLCFSSCLHVSLATGFSPSPLITRGRCRSSQGSGWREEFTNFRSRLRWF